MKTLHPDFKEFSKFLNDNKIKYLMIGSYACSYHGYSRYTNDIDFWVAISEENANKMIPIIKEFFGTTLGIKKEDFLNPNLLFRAGEPPMRLEILTSISGVNFEECYNERIEAEIDGIIVPIISLKHLRINKKAAGRPKDLADLEYLPEN